MKIGILTFQSALNYGAAYQMYALYTYLSQTYPGVDFEVVNYNSPYLSRYYSIKNQISLNPIRSVVKTLNFVIKRNRFRSFIYKNIRISKKEYTKNNICSTNDVYDMIIAGSDQIWNPIITENDLNYYLNFAHSIKKVSYAASVGLSEIPLKYKESIIYELSSFGIISVRENATMKYLQSLLPGIPVRSDIDPTLLISNSKWNEVCRNLRKKSDYVLVFEVNFSLELLSNAISFAEKKGLNVVYIGPYYRSKKVKYVPFPSPETVLSYFKDAKYVFTNSFHGTVFSIVFKRFFYTAVELSDGRNNRIIDMLKALSLDERLDCNLIENTINWEDVLAKLDVFRISAKEYLDGVIENGRR